MGKYNIWKYLFRCLLIEKQHYNSATTLQLVHKQKKIGITFFKNN